MVTLLKSPKWMLLVCGVWLSACTGTEQASVPTAVAITKPLATVVISPTPNNDQLVATFAAASPTTAPPTPTLNPSPTAYVGVFIGEASDALVFQPFTAPLFENSSANVQPTADARQCGRPIDGRIIRIWETQAAVRQRLGCPIQEMYGFYGTLQLFEKGAMYRQPDIAAVWAIVPQGTVGRYYYVEAPPPLITPLEPSSDGIVPSGDFGSVWTMVAGLPDRIGLGITDEQEIAMAVQRFDTGTFLVDASSGQAFALAVDGTMFGPFAVEINSELQITPTATGAP